MCTGVEHDWPVWRVMRGEGTKAVERDVKSSCKWREVEECMLILLVLENVLSRQIR